MALFPSSVLPATADIVCSPVLVACKLLLLLSLCLWIANNGSVSEARFSEAGFISSLSLLQG